LHAGVARTHPQLFGRDRVKEISAEDLPRLARNIPALQSKIPPMGEASDRGAK
jgi:hypothetical protein